MTLKTARRPTPFGELISRWRRHHKKSARKLAIEIGMSHVGLGYVLRGVRHTIGREKWPALISALPGLTHEQLVDAEVRSKAQEIRPWEFEGRRQEVAARMADAARNLNEDLYSDDQLERILAALGVKEPAT